MVPPLVSIITVNWNGKEHLNGFFESVRNLDYPQGRLEVLMVDNGSKDGSVKLTHKHFPWVKLIEMGKNLGFAEGNNLGIKEANGEYVLLLNNDVVVDPKLVKAMLACFSGKSVGGVGAKVLRWNESNPPYDKANSISTSWLKVSPETGMPWNFNDERQKAEIDYLPGCAMMIKREILGKLGGFDPAYFAYFEETDLCARMIKAGYRLIYAPDAVVWHKVMGSTKKKANVAKQTTPASVFESGPSNFNQVMMARNRLRFVLKNFDATALPKFALLYATDLLFKIINIAIFKPIMALRYWADWQGWKEYEHFERAYWDEAKFIWSGVFWNFIHLPETTRARRRDFGRISNRQSYNRNLPLAEVPNRISGMRNGETSVIVIPSISWFFPLHQRIHHFAALFARNGCDVLYIEPERHRENHFAKQFLEVWYPTTGAGNIFQLATAAKLSMTFRWPIQIASAIMRKLGIFGFWHKVRGGAESKLFKTQYEAKFTEYATAKSKVAFYQIPYKTEYVPMLKELGYKIVYDMVDEVAEFKGSPSYFSSGEGYLLKNADVVLTTAKPLYERAKKYNKNVLLVPNGVEYPHFVKARSNLPRPADMPKSKKPVVGYYGAIWNWFDINLLEYLARKRPNYNFVLLGTLYPAYKHRIARLENVHYLGEKPYFELPNYLSHFDAATIMFRESKLTKSVNPVKVFEYLAGGKPVVSTYLSELNGFPEVTLAHDKEEFLAALDKTIGHKPDLNTIDAFLKDKTWDARFNSARKALRS